MIGDLPFVMGYTEFALKRNRGEISRLHNRYFVSNAVHYKLYCVEYMAELYNLLDQQYIVKYEAKYDEE